MEEVTWYLQQENGTLLLVAVEGAATGAGLPCRVVGTFNPSPGVAPMPEKNTQRVSRLLAEIGVPGNLLGCAYLRTGLTLLMEEPSLGRRLTGELYPRIAEKHGATAPSVERAIRHAIGQTFARAGTEGYRAALGRLASSVGDRPTNSEFLAQVAERLRLEA